MPYHATTTCMHGSHSTQALNLNKSTPFFSFQLYIEGKWCKIWASHKKRYIYSKSGRALTVTRWNRIIPLIFEVWVVCMQSVAINRMTMLHYVNELTWFRLIKIPFVQESCMRRWRVDMSQGWLAKAYGLSTCLSSGKLSLVHVCSLFSHVRFKDQRLQLERVIRIYFIIMMLMQIFACVFCLQQLWRS